MAQVWVRTHSSMHDHLVVLCFSDCLDISIHFSFLIFSLITVFFLLPVNFIFQDVVDNLLCNSAEDLGTLAENEPPTGYEPKEYTIKEAYVDYTQESAGEQRSPNDSDYDDVTIGKMLSDACRRRRPVCRRLSVMIERGDPLFAHLAHKFRLLKKLKDTARKVSRLGFFWNDEESRFSLTVKQRFENTNSRPIMTEEGFKS